jgi:hypothetical protein
MRAVNRRALRSFLLCLALLASGLLTVAPSISRALAASEHGGWAALCSASGLKWVHVTAPAIPHHHDGVDCDYCLLLGHTATPPMLAMPPLLQPAHALPAWPLHEASTDTRHPSGLGSRGPPRTLA